MPEKLRTFSGDQYRNDEAVNLTGVEPAYTTADHFAHTAMIPAMMTGTTHFIMRSGRSTDMAEMPTPDFAVP